MINYPPNNQLNIPIAQEWIDQLQARANQQGCSIAELVEEAIAQYLATNDSNLQLSTRLVNFETELKNLKHKIAQLELSKQQVTVLSTRIGKIEQAIATSPVITVKTNSQAIALEEIAEDEFDDEPDEIIVDFLS